MNTLEYLFTKLSEECGEVQGVIFNSMPLSELVIEMRDVIALLEMINEDGGFDGVLQTRINIMHSVAKNDRVAAFHEAFNAANTMQYYISKGLVFGFDDIKPGESNNNKEMLNVAVAKFVRSIDAISLTCRGQKPEYTSKYVFDEKAILAKKEKVRTWMQHSIKKGTLQPDTKYREGVNHE